MGSTKASATGPQVRTSVKKAPVPAAAGLGHLQRTIGNAAVAALLEQGSLTPRADGEAPNVQRDAVADARKLLSYGLFDWAVTDDEAVRAVALLSSYKGAVPAALNRLGQKYVVRLLENLPANAQKGTVFVAALRAAAAWRQSWLQGLPRGAGLTATQKATLRRLFAATPDGELALLKEIFEIRFAVKTGADTSEATGIEWDAPGLRRSFKVLEKLPASHVEGNPDFKKYLRYDTGGGMGGGYYQGGGADIVSLDYTSGAASMKEKNVSEAGDALRGVNRFNKVVRHEVGHAVDARMGWSSGSEPGKASRGAWKQFGADKDAAFTAMITGSGGGISALPADRQADVVKDMKWCAANAAGSQLLTRIKARAWWSMLSAAERAEIRSDRVLSAMKYALVDSSPWYSAPNGGTALGGRVYQESYGDDWSSYAAAARARKVSQYQFRAPGEWFAEAYAAYYEPSSRGKGAKLADNDPNTKKYFDLEVDKLR